MEINAIEEYNTLVSEISEGLEKVKHLRASSSGNEERLVERMMASYEEALIILKGSSSEGQARSVISSSSDHPDSSISVIGGSPTSFEFGASNDPQDIKSRKRKPIFSELVRVSSEVPGVPLPDDGYSWRKYGQKDILGSRYPRSYYRCQFRNSKGCLATKQVHRSDDDPSILEILYRQKHTCGHITDLAPSKALLEK